MGHLSTEQWQKIKALFDEAVGLDVRERGALFDRACADEPEIRREIEHLLEGDAEELAFLTTGVADFAAPILSSTSENSTGEEAIDMSGLPASGGQAGRRIGAWHLVEEIGRGGMGVVYRAERTDGEFDQTVALKLVDRKSVV